MFDGSLIDKFFDAAAMAGITYLSSQTIRLCFYAKELMDDQRAEKKSTILSPGGMTYSTKTRKAVSFTPPKNVM